VVVSPTRTVSLKTIFSFFLLGLFGVTSVTFFLHTISTRFIDPNLVSYTLNPVVEETMKVLPVFLLLYFSRAGKNMGILDAMLLAAACGIGFGIFETVCWFNGRPGTIAEAMFGFDLKTGLLQWLPQEMTHWNQYFGLLTENKYWVGHGVTAAFVGIALGYGRKIFRRINGMELIMVVLPGIAWLWAVLDHASYNYLCAWLFTGSSKLPPLAAFIYESVDQKGLLLPKVLFLLVIIAIILEQVMIKKGLSKESGVYLKQENGRFSFFKEVYLLITELIAKGYQHFTELNRLFRLRRQLAWVNLDIAYDGSGTEQADMLRRKILNVIAELQE